MLTTSPTSPAWYGPALKEIGQHETGNNAGPAVARFIKEGHCGALGDPWCAIFVNAKLETNGVRGTRSASSQSFAHSPLFTKLSGPALGAIVVYWRGKRMSGLGHVGFYAGERDGYIWTVGGNEGDMVANEAFPEQSPTFGLVGFYWPASVALPRIGSIAIAAGTPSKITRVT